MYSFPNLEPVHCSMSSPNCCFLTCIQVSQEARKVVWYSHLLKNFPQFVVIHIVKDFTIVNEAGVDVYLEFPCFSYDPTDVGNYSSWTPGSSQFTYCWRLAWRICLFIILFFYQMWALLREEHSFLPWYIPNTRTATSWQRQLYTIVELNG